MEKHNIDEVKSYLHKRYGVVPGREGVSVDGDPFLAYTKLVRRFLRKNLFYELYIEVYADNEDWIAAVYSEDEGKTEMRSWCVQVPGLDDFAKCLEEDFDSFTDVFAKR